MESPRAAQCAQAMVQRNVPVLFVHLACIRVLQSVALCNAAFGIIFALFTFNLLGVAICNGPFFSLADISEGHGACDKKPHADHGPRIADEAHTMHAADVTMMERCGGATALVTAWLLAPTACVTTTDSPKDAGSMSSDAVVTGDTERTDGAPGDSLMADATMIRDAGAPISDAALDDDAAPCTPDPDATVVCPTDLPPDDDCPDAAPSYANTVASIIAARCTVCHRAGGPGASIQFDTYAKIAANNNKIHMVTQVHMCRMPPPSCAEPLTADERQPLLQWLVCGGPNN